MGGVADTAGQPGSLRLALTFDDAPSMREGGVYGLFEPGRMDRIREVLLSEGVQTASAFVVSDWAEGSEPALARWCEAGFELGNHTADHRTSSSLSTADFLAGVDRCDSFLRQFDAFASAGTRWFRFPCLDRGRDPAHRRELVEALSERGYTVAGCSIDSFDYAYETPLAVAELGADPSLAARVLERYARTVLRAIDYHAQATRLRYGTPMPQSLLFHFSGPTVRELEKLLRACRSRGVEFCSLSEAVEAPLHEEFDQDLSRQGLYAAAVDDRGLKLRVLRRLRALSERRGWFSQRDLGPVVPYLG